MTTPLSRLQACFLVLFLGGIASVGHAGFVNETDESNPFSTNAQVRITNSEQGSFELVYGVGRHQPLVEALGQIIPKKYALQMVDVDAWTKVPVSWTGKREWTDVFKEVIANVPQIVADIDVSAKTVTLRRKGGSAASPTTTTQAVTTPYVVESRLWVVRASDKTIRRTLNRWAKDAGYSVVWGVLQDISIDTDATFSGSFEDAVQSVLEAISASEFPVEAVVYDNKVIRIVKKARDANSGAAQ